MKARMFSVTATTSNHVSQGGFIDSHSWDGSGPLRELGKSCRNQRVGVQSQTCSLHLICLSVLLISDWLHSADRPSSDGIDGGEAIHPPLGFITSYLASQGNENFLLTVFIYQSQDGF